MTKAAKGPTSNRLTSKQWAEAEALWESGLVTYEDLRKRFGLAQSSFERHFKRKNIIKGAKAIATRKKVDEKLEAEAVDEAAVLAARIRETKEQHYTMANNLGKLIWSEVLEAKRDKKPVAVALNNIKALREAVASLAIVRAEKWSVLGLDRPDAVDPDELPELVISELTAEQIEKLRSRDEIDIDDLEGLDALDGPPNQSLVQVEDDSDIDDDDDDDENDIIEEG